MNENKLIYVSLGTFFNGSFQVFEKILAAFRIFDEHMPSAKSPRLQAKNLYVVIACGPEVYQIFQNKIQRENYVLPGNVFLLKTAPQIDILKRAHLFISHCGMNSTSEAIYYGVPIVGLPILADQPRVAYRILDELGFGVRLSAFDLAPNILRDTIVKVLSDKSYTERILRYTRISRKYNGVKNSANYAIEFLRENAKKTHQ